MKPADKDIPVILAGLVIAALPYGVRLPIWITLWCLFFWGYAGLMACRLRPAPKPWLRQALILTGLAGVLVTYEGVLAGDTFVGMLAIMVSLKPLEIRTYRDKMVTVFLAYFLILTHLLYDNSFFIAIYMAASVGITTAVLIAVNQPAGRLTFHLKLSALIMIQAFPVAMALFVLFPRFQGQFWGGLNPAAQPTGFSERLAPGDVSRLVRNSAVAFRVDFEGNIPAPERLYWRGIVFWHFTGEAWERGALPPIRPVPFAGQASIQYTVSLEPHQKRWWFSLDLPQSPPPNTRMSDDFTLTSWRPVAQRRVYTLRSHMAYHTGAFKSWETIALELPAQGNPRAREMARKWALQTGEPRDIVGKALSFLKDSGFSYTLNPAPLAGDRIDDFLFRTRNGYCEHFASAFAFLMRAAGIPARIVGGYLGGERNPFGNYLIVRQSDAHVWVEVWLPQTGWTRLDPTAAVAPARVRLGAAAALPPAERPIYLSSPVLAPLVRYLKPLQFAWDRLNSRWDQWVIGYSGDYRRQLLAGAGIKGLKLSGVLVAMVILAAAAGIALGLFFAVRSGSEGGAREGAAISYDRFCRKLARAALCRRSGQGPVDYARQVAAARADLRAAVEEITALYVRLRYGRGGNKADEKRLRAIVKEFKPKKSVTVLF